MIFFEYAALLSMVLLLSGCCWFRDDRPEPVGTPYVSAVQQGNKVYSSDEAVNAAVSAVSLKMAVSQQGPFRVIPRKDRTTSLGYRTIDSLTRMGLSRLQAPDPLCLEDLRNDKNEWTVILHDASGKIFYRKTFLLKGK